MESQLEDGNTVTYQFEIDDSDWQEWKMTVPRTKSLDTRIRELIEVDTEGRIEEHDDEEVAEPELADSQLSVEIHNRLLMRLTESGSARSWLAAETS